MVTCLNKSSDDADTRLKIPRGSATQKPGDYLSVINERVRWVYFVFLCALFALSTATPAEEFKKIRVSISTQAENSGQLKLISLLSREVRRLESVIVTDSEPDLRVFCAVTHTLASTGARDFETGYAASLAITTTDNRLLMHGVRVDGSLERLSRELALLVDGALLKLGRRAEAVMRSAIPPQESNKGSSISTEHKRIPPNK